MFKKSFILVIIACVYSIASFGQQNNTSNTIASNDSLFSKAMQEKIAGNYDTAIILFNELAKAKPKDATARYQLGKIYYIQKNDPINALKEAKIAAQLAPDNKWIQEFYADMLALSEQDDAANNIYQNLSDKETLSKSYLTKQIVLLLKAEKYDDALKVLDQLYTQHDVEEEDYLLLKNEIFLKQTKYDSALNVANQLVAIDGNNPAYQLYVANAYDQMLDTTNALSILGNVADKFKDNSYAQLVVLDYYLTKDHDAKANELFNKDIFNSNFSDSERASIISAYLTKASKDSAMMQNLGNVLHQGSEASPIDTFIVQVYASYLLSTNKTDSATYQYKRLINHNPTSYTSWSNLLLVYAQQNNMDSLLKYSNKAKAYFPNDVNVNYFSGVAYQSLDRPDSAIVAYNNALTNFNLDSAYMVSPTVLYTSLADVYYTQNDYTLSDSMYEKALQADPQNTVALNNYSYYLSERNTRLDDAKAMSEKSLELRKNEPTYLDTYGWILYKQGEYKKAKKYIIKAIDLSDTDRSKAALYEHLGDIELKMGKTKSALEAWRNAAKYDDVSPDVLRKIKENE